jgi:hypothetical protein
VPAAAIVVDVANKSVHVSKITLGFIKAGLKSANGQRRVKITDGIMSIKLSVRDNTSHQEVWVYVTNMQEAKLAIANAKEVRKAGIAVTFQEEAV